MDRLKLCRSCLSESPTVSLFTDIPMTSENTVTTTFADALMEFASITIFENDGFPESICSECESQITSLIKFRATCRNSNSTLEEWLIVKREHETQAANDYDDESTEEHDDVIVENEASEEPKLKKPRVTKPLKFTCDVCSKSYKFQKNLDKHKCIKVESIISDEVNSKVHALRQRKSNVIGDTQEKGDNNESSNLASDLAGSSGGLHILTDICYESENRHAISNFIPVQNEKSSIASNNNGISTFENGFKNGMTYPLPHMNSIKEEVVETVDSRTSPFENANYVGNVSYSPSHVDSINANNTPGKATFSNDDYYMLHTSDSEEKFDISYDELRGSNSEGKTIAEETLTTTIKTEAVDDIDDVYQEGKHDDDLSSSSNVKQQCEKKPTRKYRPINCPFCDGHIRSHLSRHLFRHHQDNPQVQKILSLKSGSRERLAMVAALRKQGNFHMNIENNIITPLRSSSNPGADYFVCSYCLGYYTRRLLYKHVRQCSQKPDNILHPGRKCLITSHTFMASKISKNQEFLKTDHIKDEVFSIMRADSISMLAKTDPLICLFGEYLIVKHKKPVVVSNKMREMSRMLQMIRSTKKEVETFFDLLRPDMFKTLVFATKVISGYDELEKYFKAPSLAIHMGSNLKKICDVADKFISENTINPNICWVNKEQKISEIKDLKKMIENHWCNEIANEALKSLQIKRSKKTTIFPVADDIIIFQTYLNNLARRVYEEIIRKKDIEESYKTLAECMLVLTTMFNGRRIEHIQDLTIDNYITGTFDVEQPLFSESRTALEKTLSEEFKRVVSERTKPMPILFSKQNQTYINCLLRIRETDEIVPKTNPYLFANPRSENKCMTGAYIIRRHAKHSGAQQPTLLTSTRVREHIATTLQLMTLEPGEIERIAKFMGYTQEAYAEFYRLHQDVYQAAKVAKILLLIEKGREEIKGKSFEDIDLEKDVPNSSESDTDDDVDYDMSVEDSALGEGNFETATASEVTSANFDCTNRNSTETIQEDNTEKTKRTARRQTLTSPKETDRHMRKIETFSGRLKWTQQQKNIVLSYFKEHVIKKITPKKHECDAFLKVYGQQMPNKDWDIFREDDLSDDSDFAPEYKCSHCDQSFKYKSQLTTHEQKHSSDRLFLCNICGKGYTDKYGLKSHLSTHSDDRPYMCKYCGVRFRTQGAVRVHVRTHTGERPYKCSHCPKSFAQAANLQQHERVHTGEKPYECNICGRRFNHSGKLKIHLRSHSGEKPFGCPYCDKCFAMKETMKKHIWTHTGERPTNYKPKPRVDTSHIIPSHECDICHKMFKFSANLKAHVRRHSKEKPFLCSTCGKSFSDKHSLSVHLNTHTEALVTEKDRRKATA